MQTAHYTGVNLVGRNYRNQKYVCQVQPEGSDLMISKFLIILSGAAAVLTLGAGVAFGVYVAASVALWPGLMMTGCFATMFLVCSALYVAFVQEMVC